MKPLLHLTKYIIILYFSSNTIFAHGESELGPNGGYIRMPGGFHTELVPTDEPKKFKVFLLDISFKNPLVDASSVEMSYSGGSSRNATCSKRSKYFECTFKTTLATDSGLLNVTAVRMGIKGSPAIYNVPLKLEPIKQ